MASPPASAASPGAPGSSPGSAALTDVRAKLFELIRARSFGRGRIVLASGRVSDFYFDMKPTMLRPDGAAWLAELMLRELDAVAADYIGGLEMGAVPLVAALAQLSFLKGRPLPAFFVRKRAKDHGAKKLVEGLTRDESLRDKKVVIVEDVTTTGDSARQAVEAVRGEGADVVLVLSMVDRLEGAAEAFHAAGLPFRSLFTAAEFLNS
jgi:orotate phosphoribosyltransferase